MIRRLPIQIELETKQILKECALAHQKLGELKGVSQIIPNEDVLINTISLQEAKGSSEIENIVTTHDELYRSQVAEDISLETKEVKQYAKAIYQGWQTLKEKNMLTINDICHIQKTIKNNDAGIRTQAGTTLKNNSGQTIYTPPQDAEEIKSLMKNLEAFINDNSLCDIDPLIKMAVIHHQFETIHPFYDGNGRVGRIINILYLIFQGLLELPVLYLSRYIIEKKQTYYKLLQEVREDETKWEEWILFMLRGVSQTAKQTIDLIKDISKLMIETKHKIRKYTPEIYSQDLINNLFKQPYTKIDFLSKDLMVNRKTASKYLDILVDKEMLSKVKVGRSNYYINILMVKALMNR